ncbi:MAG: helicase HerA-like domain-containing protein, partial [Saprospiraceae bacterium]|nr:helicase HerA-like domain-containing protein [Saprospiraceae bacterium]
MASRLISAPIEVPVAGEYPRLSFWQYCTAASSSDYGNVRIIDSSGAETVISENMSRGSSSWTRNLLDLTPFAGQKVRLVFFFDEAHLLFKDAPKVLCDKIEQVVRLIRSKGVGVYFVTQHPLDIPDEVLGQLGHKVQHA